MSIEAALLLTQALLLDRLLLGNFLAPFLVRDGKMLLIIILPLIVFLVSETVSFFSRTHKEQQRFWIVTVGCLIIMGMMLGKQVQQRVDGPNPRGLHDGAVQTEAAVKFLLKGVNPYRADYSTTPFGFFPNPVDRTQPNVAWTHYAYPPGQFLLATPILLLQPWLSGWVDGRTPMMLAFLGFVALLLRYQPTWSMRTRIALLTIGNPLVWLYVLAGFNDSLYIVGLLFVTWGVMSKKWTLAGVALAVTIGAKQSAWIVLPLLVWWIWARYRHRLIHGAELRRFGLVAGIGTVAIFLPFLLWDFHAIYDDIIVYVSGGYSGTYPVSGATLMQYWRVLGFTDSPVAPVPSTIFQAIALVPIIVAFGVSLLRRPAMQTWLTSVAVVSITFFIFNRYFYNNYLSALILFVVGAYALKNIYPESSPQTTSHKVT